MAKCSICGMGKHDHNDCFQYEKRLIGGGVGYYEAREIIREAKKNKLDIAKVVLEAIKTQKEYNEKPKRCFECTREEYVKYNMYRVWAVDKEDALRLLEEDEGMYEYDSDVSDSGGNYENWKDITDQVLQEREQNKKWGKERLKRRLSELENE